MSQLHLQGIVFDADGTLFDTERLARAVWLSVAREWKASAVEEHYMELIGRNREGIVSLLKSVCPPDFPLDKFLLTCSQRSREKLHHEGVPVKEGAREVLELCTCKGLPIALATSSGAATTQYKLESSGLDRYFQAVITGDKVTHGKPHPEIYLTACQALGIEPVHSMAVEDSKNGVFSAHAAGMMTVLIPDLLPPTPELEALAYRKFDSLFSLKDYLTQML